ncbi:MAG: JAB domain-containing protein [bacterium]
MRGNNIVKYIFGTRKKKQGALLDIPVLEHIIIAREGYVSFKEEEDLM